MKPCSFLVVCLLLSPNVFGDVTVVPADSAPLKFAADEIERAAARAGVPAPTVRLTVSPGESQSFSVSLKGSSIHVVGGDAIGAMYGGFEVAEAIRLGTTGEIQPKIHRPYIQKRGVKFNVPLDARTPSYDDSGDAAQRNIAEMWNLEFWTEFLDQLARDRYNMLSLWNPHPFPSMVRSEEFPEVALDDVCVTTLVPNGRENEWGEPQLVSSNVVENLKVVKRMSIEEKIAFWQAVLGHAQDRGIDVYFITWNICPNSVAAPVRPYYRTYDSAVNTREPAGKYGVTHEIDNEATIRYLRDAVKTFLLTYPTVKGFGVTSGEHMPITSEADREKWMWDTYAEGILDAKRLQPEREVRFIHRVWNTNLDKIMARWEEYPDSFELGFKYAKARLYSSPQIPFADGLVRTMKPRNLKAWWNLRNDDIFVHRWGDPDYVRAFLTKFDLSATAGYHMGSDGYVWGREYISRHPKSPRELEVHKHWYAFMLWGRLGYDPSLDRGFFVARLAERFPGTDAARLYESWQTASGIIPLVNRFHWRDWDHMWSVENSNSHVEGFRGVDEFIHNPTMQGSGLVSVQEYVRCVVDGATPTGTTPIQVADRLDDFAETARHKADRVTGDDPDLRATLDDIRGMAWLGHYYAAKIRAAVSLARFRSTGDGDQKKQAIEEIQAAYDACTRYVDHSQARYRSQMLARTGRFDWSAMLTSARKDVALVKAAGKVSQ